MNTTTGTTARDWTPDTYWRAWEFAATAHQGQTYDTPIPGQTLPYLTHIGAVTMEVVAALRK
ncbi:MAG: hypothetical protein R3E95_15260 [Thiolinea sp.]